MQPRSRIYAAWALAALLAITLQIAPGGATLVLTVVPVALATGGRGWRGPWGVAGLLVWALVLGPLTPGAARADVTTSEALVAVAAILVVAARRVPNEPVSAPSGVSHDEERAAPAVGTNATPRDALLTHLVELSRSLTTSMTREELLPKVCAAVGAVLHGAAAVVMLRDGEWLEIVCHAGFGARGPALGRLPAPRSLAAAAITADQSTVVDDLDARPGCAVVPGDDLPHPRSAMSCPVRLHGRPIGVIEAYLPSPRAFGAPEVLALESLAAQVSISLQSSELAESSRYAQRRFETAFQTAPVGLAIVEHGGDGEIRMNPAALAMFGLSEARELRMIPLAAGADDGVRAAELRSLAACHLPLARALRGERISGELQSLDVPVRGAVTFLTSAAPILDDQAAIEGAIASFADITEVNRLAREVDARRRQAETESARKSRFLAALSHDIRTPANAIGLLAELLDDAHLTSEPDQRVKRLARSLRGSAHALVALVTDVLDYARFESGAVELELADVALGPLVEETCEPWRAAALEKGLGFTVRVDAVRGLAIRTDRAKLARILTNLASNALKFTRAGSIEVTASVRGDGRVELAVRDSGIGLAEGDRKLIFDEFTQVENAHRDPGAGSGLGLTIAARLSAMLGGSIAVASELGQGSTFTLTLPTEAASNVAAARAASSRGAAGAPSSHATLRGLRVLVVEDHQPSREALLDLLCSEGAEVFTVGDTRGALDALAAREFHALLLDLMLPDGDGLAVLEEVRRSHPAEPRAVFVVTGDITPRRLARLALAGRERLVPKPVDFGRLIRWLGPIAGAVRAAQPDSAR